MEKILKKNTKFLQDLLQIISGIEYGVVTPELELHQQRVVSAKFTGWKRMKFENNHAALEALLKRINFSLNEDESSKLHFVVKTRKGKITDVFWTSEITRHYN